ncbi:MAG TPA: NYN domain-containing protein [Euzebyales bacterium]
MDTGGSADADDGRTRTWVIDALNVVGTRPDGWWRDRSGAVARIVDEIVRWRATINDDVLVVVDGHPSGRVREGMWYGVKVRLTHTSRPDAADDEIATTVAAATDPTAMVVVTADRRLRARVEACGAAVEGPRRFLTRLADVAVRREDRVVLAHFGVDESALLGRGGEARVYGLDDERVVRLSHPGTDLAMLRQRRRLLDDLAGGDIGVALPRVLEQHVIAGRGVSVERRLPGRDALDVLDADGTDRAALVRDHLEVARRIATLPCPLRRFGPIIGDAPTAETFRAWSVARLGARLARGGPAFAGIDPVAVTDDLLAVLPPADRPVVAHLDAFLGNMLADGDRISAVLDFGGLTAGAIADLDPLLAVAYLAPEITPTAVDADRATARAWVADVGLDRAVVAARRWAATMWAGEPDDQPLRQWCRRVLS